MVIKSFKLQDSRGENGIVLDRLLLLLDTGSSASVKNTAAKQLAQLAAKSVISDVNIQENIPADLTNDTKSARQESVRHVVQDPTAWSELMAVIARIIPYLQSKSSDTRSTAASALSQIFTLVPLWQPCHSPTQNGAQHSEESISPDFPSFSVQDLLLQGNLLLSSTGKEFLKPAGILSSAAEVKRARKEAMGRLGLGFLDDVADDIDLDKELAAEDQDVEMDPPPRTGSSTASGGSPMDVCLPDSKSRLQVSRSATPLTSPATPGPVLSDDVDVSTLSARERNRLKRKRKPGNSAFVAAPPPSAGNKATPTASSSKANSIAAPKPRVGRIAPDTTTPEKVVIDPTKGGAVSPKTFKQSKALDVEPGCWIWDGVVKVFEVDLFSPAWQVRQGAAMALRELLKIQGKYGGMKDHATKHRNELAHEKWCNDLAAKFLCVLVLDRFADFVSDQVFAPVRETVSQTLASLLIHMPRRSVVHVHSILLQMIKQEFQIPVPKRHKTGCREDDSKYIWEVRHAGLLGIKYEVAVRSDLFAVVADMDTEGKPEDGVKQETVETLPESGLDIMRGIVDAAILGLGDNDDDVRAVAASCLIPVAGHLVERLPEALDRVLVVLWHCLSGMKDDLSSSVGAVMDLLGKLVAYDKVIDVLASDSLAMPLTMLAPTLFPFFRHTISNVRLSVVDTLHSFMTVASLPRDWISTSFLSLLFQNLIVEERNDVREASLSTWRTALSIISSREDWMQSLISQQVTLEWYEMVMTPLGQPINTANFFRPSMRGDTERHNVDKNMLMQDFALISADVTLKARVAAATALAQLIAFWPVSSVDEMFTPFLGHYIGSASMLQKFLAAVVAEEWAHEYAKVTQADAVELLDKSRLARDISDSTLAWLQSPPPTAYHEMAFSLARIHAECVALLNSFSTMCKLPMTSIPQLGHEIDIDGTRPGAFSISTAQAAVGQMYGQLKTSLGRTKKREQGILDEKRTGVLLSIERYLDTKNLYDIRIAASFAAAFVAFKSTPDKVSPVVKGVMNGIKNEDNVDLQTRSAVAVAAFVNYCAEHNITQPPEKIVKNLCTFMCQDTQETPTFAYHRTQLDGVLSFRAVMQNSNNSSTSTKIKDNDIPLPPADDPKTRIPRRGAGLAFWQLSAKFGPRLLEIVPNMWHSVAGGLLNNVQKCDSLLESQFGQDVIDSLSVLEAVVPTLHEDLWPKLIELFPKMHLSLRSRFAIIRQLTANCFATICDVMPAQAMLFVVENVIPMLGDPLSLHNRQGAIELIYHIVGRLDVKALPYVLFMIVPVLGRMSDSDDEVRSTATNTFASLVKMVPLEAGLPDPPGFSEELLERRKSERQFLAQLLDGSKVEPYTIPIPIKAELRPYQREGVNWLAFLAKYQLHGILCDDMGLGKTLQSICILASKHFERAQRYKETRSPDAVPLPSLIVCPPTLTGHWYYEILKYVDGLRPVLYTGNSRERTKILGRLKKYEVIITSYEVVRNDIGTLSDIDWLYCILDEGHIIKNAKTKLSKAVKNIRSQHRVILSGTPIQNNVLELWSLFDFLMPGFLGTESSFNERFGKPILANRDGKSKNAEGAALALEALHKQVLPFLLRRLKEDVLNDLPPKIIQDYYCELSDMQKYLYDDFSKSRALESAQGALQSGGKSGQQHVFQSLQYLRKLCNHPALVLKGEQEATKAALSKVDCASTGLTDIQHAPKLLALRQLLTDCGIGLSAPSPTSDIMKTELADNVSDASSTFSQHRVLIFCQLKRMLDIIETDLFKQHMPSVTYMRLDGDVEPSKRHAIVQTFNSDPSIDCLLLTTHVGGLGLTLTGADTVIFVEHDWNPMKDLQAMDRAHRIGQKKVVNVYRLITKGTLEEKIMGLQRFKLNIANSVVTQQNTGLASMDTDLVLDLFRRTTEEEDAPAAPKKKAKESSSHVSQKNVLEGLEDLPAEDEYQGLDLASFMGSLGQ
ncbi:hypothetical protein FISHEDRAFT_67850 [Fistulina hepatica ATCC 64428]|nr:hypothetical protein FISHEDRAFT_67850 [Fistulina hepatica ATCC 64428]